MTRRIVARLAPVLALLISVANIGEAKIIGFQEWHDPTFGGTIRAFECWVDMHVQCSTSTGACLMPTEIDPNYGSLFFSGFRILEPSTEIESCVRGSIFSCATSEITTHDIDTIRVQENFHKGVISFQRNGSHISVEVPLQPGALSFRFIASHFEGGDLVINSGTCGRSYPLPGD